MRIDNFRNLTVNRQKWCQFILYKRQYGEMVTITIKANVSSGGGGGWSSGVSRLGMLSLLEVVVVTEA